MRRASRGLNAGERALLRLLVDHRLQGFFVGEIEPSAHRLGDPIEPGGPRPLAAAQGLGEKLGDDPLKRLSLFPLDLFDLPKNGGLDVDQRLGHLKDAKRVAVERQAKATGKSAPQSQASDSMAVSRGVTADAASLRSPCHSARMSGCRRR
jgi:hypothetical protein